MFDRKQQIHTPHRQETKGCKINDRFKFRLPFYNNKGEFSHFEFILIGEGLPAYNAGVMHNNNEYEQCTGLKDKNGNLIYEGDILLCNRKDVKCATGAEIHYKSSGVVQREKNGKYFIVGEDWYGSDITFYNECAEIIGNVHKKEMQWLKIACNDFVRIAKQKGWVD